MNLRLNPLLADGLKSPSQIARKVTEAWAQDHIFCAACSSNTLLSLPANTKAVDFRCPSCGAEYQLKSSKSWSERRIPDGAYSAIIKQNKSDSVPNLLILQYTRNWFVEKLVLIPSFFLFSKTLEKRKPLAPTARRAGWIGCNILLNQIANDGKLVIIDRRQIVSSPEATRLRYDNTRPLANIGVNNRGWTLAVLKVVRELQKTFFTLSDVYHYEKELAQLYPSNRHIRAKIRQQLQILRDIGILQFEGDGGYRLLR